MEERPWVERGTEMMWDGRQLSYAESGDPGGSPVVFLHGTPGSRRFRPPDRAVLADLGVRFVTVDRPGYGGSDPLPERKLVDWPKDVQQLADRLGLQRFVVAGISGGGPHAAACAYALGDRVSALGLINSLSPFDHPGATEGMNTSNSQAFFIAQHLPWLVRPVCALTAWQMRRNLGRFAEKVASQMAEPDRRVLRRPEVRAVGSEDFREAVLQGGRGLASDLIVLSRPWGFAPEEIPVPVRLWHGTEDRNVPVEHGRWLADHLPGCEAIYFEGEGHLSVHDHWAEILRYIAQDGNRP